ncbi:MAG TPA: hypothetical protein VJ483_01550, partial [Holophagaceae bacterium]|nr:hypothetical protein [Holophagaceae bacterium]
MRAFTLLPLLFLLACAQPLPVDGPSTGADCAHPVVVQASTETDGIAAEYRWLKEHRPGAVVLNQRLFSCGDRVVDILSIRA